jgi:hypothetical protein
MHRFKGLVQQVPRPSAVFSMVSATGSFSLVLLVSIAQCSCFPRSSVAALHGPVKLVSMVHAAGFHGPVQLVHIAY